MTSSVRLVAGSRGLAASLLDLSARRLKGSAGPSHAAWAVPPSCHSISEIQRLSSGQSPVDLVHRRNVHGVMAMISGVPPRHCTLREFGDGIDESQLMLRPIRVRSSNGSADVPQATVLELIAANAEASAQVESFETVAGRAAMMGFLMATVKESVTGVSVFQGIEADALVPLLTLLAGVCAVAGSAALAWQASNHVAGILRTGCRNIMDTAVDSIIEGLFFETTDSQPWDSAKK